ncbi:E3 ubiquitin-protein ligase TRIM33-like [Strongylocentrotus purpuratus]|uniref:Uncharacterized protein n=1 Tax=Strongylocentrotus purpuratus TaxID=7668 RepID=A0A7M7GR30_STRPU|nr:E3 ubiquitin-protein ligase TRIM33-like [Strongylocentrotus purpuratus]|eukprot:XP_003729738.2 PREDICTED: E3 ubiquitin-protein ligase TRIM33-like [Strongylocentrotus purpuratus]
MAEKTEEAASQNILCPLCLDVFDNASMLICGHTFCKQCLERYDAAHRDLDHMVCPLCRKVTKLAESRVAGLPPNFTVKALVDEYHSSHAGINTVLDGQTRCTLCELQGDAVSFCYECGTFMCAKCHHGHSQLTSFFKGHQVVSMKDVVDGTASIGQVRNKCFVHKHENKDLFCEDCKVYLCLKCMIVDHRDHSFKNQADVEREIQQKVDNILKRSNDRKNEFEKHIQNIESKRQEIYTAIQKLQGNIEEAFMGKIDKLKENRQLLITETQLLQENCDKELDALKSRHRQKIEAISSSVSLVANGRSRHLEKDSLAAHSLISSELEGLLEEAIDEKSVTVLMTRVIISSSCNNIPSRVRVYDRYGESGDPISAKEGEYLYPAVDEEDRVFIASVNQPAGRIQITLYRPEGLKLKKLVVNAGSPVLAYVDAAVLMSPTLRLCWDWTV